ncbi:MAG: oligosaccharide flippase family protein [Sphingomonas bacterium]|nr:oligosaccharide flippase family protein [Sphingomonas bacterium]
MKHWFKDQHFRSLLKNSGYLAASRAVAAVGAMATLAFAARGLGVTAFGLLILIHSYIQAASGLTKFNSWQMVVRYGSPALERGDVDTFRRAARFAVGLDLTSGVITMIGAMALLPLVAPWFGIPDHLLDNAILYCLLLPTLGSAAASGVLRALDRFDLVSWQGTITPNLRALLTFFAWWYEAGFVVFLLIWFVTDLIGDLVQWGMAWAELRRRDLRGSLWPSLSAAGLDGGWQFAASTNLTASLSTAWGPLARLLVGGLVSPAAAGLYRVASSLADAAQRPSDFLNKAFYPEVMRLDPASKTAWNLMVRATLLGTAMGLPMMVGIALIGKFVLLHLFGPEFVGAYGVLVVLLGAPLIAMLSFPLPAMLHSVGRTNVPLLGGLVGVIAYLGSIFPLVDHFGLIGAGLGFLIGRAAMVAVMALALAGEHKRLRRSG